MSIKLILLKSGEKIISDAKELVSGSESDEQQVSAYLLNDPHIVTTRSKVLLSEDNKNDEAGNFEIDVVLSPWVILSQDKNFAISPDWVVTVCEPLASIKKMYIEKTNSQLSVEEKENEDE